MEKAAELLRLEDIPCSAHTIQLAVNDALLVHRCVSDVIGKARRIVEHLKHSPHARDKLKMIQIGHGLKQHLLIQDEPTRWNSAFYMLQQFLEQKTALITYLSEMEGLPNLDQNDWKIIESTLAILQPLEEFTKKVSLIHRICLHSSYPIEFQE